MNLNLSAAYTPDGDKVYVDFRSDDGSGNLTVADQVLFTLYQQSENSIGAKTLIPLSTLTVTAPYAQAAKNFEVNFLHPPRRVDLFIDAQATFGASTLPTGQIAVGQSASPYQQMVIPDNAIWEVDPFEVIPTQGGVKESNTPNPNPVVLDPAIQTYIATFDFSIPQPPEVYEDLTYQGGGNRLLINSASNQFVLQQLNQAPWSLPAFCFMDPAGVNLLPNSFFLQATGTTPQNWQIDSQGVIIQQTLSFDHQTSSDAQLWSIRMIQNNMVNASMNDVAISAIPKVAVQGGLNYTFSTYLRYQAFNRATQAPKVSFQIKWYDGSTFLSETTQLIDASQYPSLTLASAVMQAPSAATMAEYIISVPLSYGDDMQFNLLGPQLELGVNPTTRMDNYRAKDQFSIPQYNAVNQKIRFQLIAGFASADVTASTNLTVGDLVVSFEPGNLVKANLVGYRDVSAPLTFQSGDFLDLTFAHQSGDVLSIMQNGNVIGQVALPVVTPSIQPLNIEGIGVELLSLSVFSRV